MEVVGDPKAFSDALARARAAGASIGLVPTMGALHAGHRSLLERAVAERDHAAVSIFVNPLQFDRTEDLARYPADLGADLAVCADAGVSTVFAPSAAEMFSVPPATTVSVAGLSERWEGASRPGHLQGVATIVAKLFSIAGACAAYFGEKDFQQLAVVRRMASDLSMPVEVVACPTVREPDGLALSSRNARLSAPERAAAGVLWRALVAGLDDVAAGEDRPERVAATMASVVGAEPIARLDYAAAVNADDLTVPTSISRTGARGGAVEDAGGGAGRGAVDVRLLVAAEVGPVRLIDNVAASRAPVLAARDGASHDRVDGAPARRSRRVDVERTVGARAELESTRGVSQLRREV